MEPRPNEWELVIKVKYGDTLRRIGAYVNGQLMDQNMSKLRTKIISLFKFSPDTDFILTYTDEDGDTVTLVDDDELRDAIINQHLNPLRINVQLKSNINSSYANSEGASAAPTKSPELGTQPLQISAVIGEALSAVPEPYRSLLSNLSHDVTKAVSCQPAFTRIVESFSNLGISNASQPSHVPSAESSGIGSGASTHLVDLNVSDEPKASSDPIPVTVIPSMTSVNPVPENTQVNPVPENTPNQHEVGSMTQGMGSATSAFHPVVPRHAVPSLAGYPSLNDLITPVCTRNNHLGPQKEASDARPDEKSFISSAPSNVTPANKSQNFGSPWPFATFSKDGFAHSLISEYGFKEIPLNTADPFTSQNGSSAQTDVPVSRHIGVPTPDVPPTWSLPGLHPYRRSHSSHEYHPRTFHRGVQCDGCGMHPIVGPRYKSNVKEDYDLCSICFTQMGNETDYTRIDRATYRSPRLLKELYNPHRYRLPTSHTFHGCGARPARVKLESRFIQDVTVLDGTIMPPLTHFTKIWRMRNNGTIPWPVGTQLVWVGGDQFGDRGSTELEIPVNGCPVDEEIDIAVDFTAPSRPGRYISYWRMASPSGQKFGQRVWVLIQVDNSRPNSASGSGSHASINLNLPPEVNGRNVEIIDVNAEPLDGGFFPKPNVTTSNATEELVKPSVPGETVEPTLVADDAAGGGADDVLVQPTASALYPLIDLSASSSLVDSSPAADVTGDDSLVFDSLVENTLLKELEEMGFKQIDLNKEVLRLNEYDMEQSVDDLCGFAEWDPLLTELEEMGFYDKDLNKKLLIKNGGSIKRAVLDLIAGEKAE